MAAAAPFTHVIFDLDGTLLNTLEDLANACNYTCKAMGWPTFPVDRYRYKVGNGMLKLIERIMPAEFIGDQAAFDIAYRTFSLRYTEHKEDNTAPYPGILQALDALREAGITLAVLTNKDHTAATPLVEHYFGRDRFALVQGRIDAFPPKPAAPITLHVLQQLKANPATTLYVGDSNVDVQCGHNAGLRACGASWGFRGRRELEEEGADFIADTPSKIIDIVLGR